MTKQPTLREFILKSNKAGFAGGESKNWKKEKDSSTTIEYTSGVWKSHDNYFGGEPYGGRIIVTQKGSPYWMMVYYGWVEKVVKPDLVYKVLQEALKKMPKRYPFRGPKKLVFKNFTYKNSWKGDLKRYSGEEEIFKGKKSVYKAFYLGGLVDQKRQF